MKTTTDLELAAARATLYRFLALVASDPRAERCSVLEERSFQDLADAAAGFLRAEVGPAELGPGELGPAHLQLGALLDGIREPRELRVRDYDELFGLVLSKECPPYETEYCPQTFSVYRSQEIGDIAGFYRAFGLEPSRDPPERHDHIALELDFLAWLIGKEIRAVKKDEVDHATVCRDAQKRFFRDHLGWWASAFAFALRKKVDGIRHPDEIAQPACSFPGAFGSCLAALIGTERSVLEIEPPNQLVGPRPGQPDSLYDCSACTEGVS